MDRKELRKFKMQLAMLGGLVILATVAALVISTQRGFARKFVKEKYAAVPKSLKSEIESIKTKSALTESYKKLKEKDRLLLYDAWMTDQLESDEFPRLILKEDFQIFSRRAERTLVCGSTQQRDRALEFFRLGNHPDTIPILEKARRWAGRRKLDSFESDIANTLESIRGE